MKSVTGDVLFLFNLYNSKKSVKSSIAKSADMRQYIDAMKKQNGQYQFEVLFTPQKEGGFTVEVPDLPGCISEGDT